ncbi:ubiquinol oxidase subunit II [Paracoccus benzoatiresistens]|uniref:Ubiquinol oxidase polypeptide II n=1 Tax=Paracoccus benzoatiresistens TaxID=2997341 RepID=A0ABT4J007_9RHOB|nr:ubiquinol oxidase subunit II [Paracoccus sp. EF6]MCZ0960453.1 ubiquinol oxidase subunit II [Paracoccus sp. EF6]
MTYLRKRLLWLLPFLALPGCKPVVLSPSGDIAARQADLLVQSTLLMLIIIIPVMALTVWFAWRYRANNSKASYDPDWDHSTKLELVIWAIPLLIIVSLGALTWVGTHLLDPYRPLDRISAEKPIEAAEPLQVQVVAMDWKWLFIYPEQGVATVNQMAVPVDRPVEFTLTSTSVMNAFYIPAMAGMIYAMPGMQTTLHGVFNHPGEYQGLASHYSGAGFSGMRFKAVALDDAGFDDWIAQAAAGGETLDRGRYLELEKPSENVAPMTFAEVDPQLFSRVVNMCVEENRMCMAEMMAYDAQGGLGLPGIANVAALADDDAPGTARPVLGLPPFQVSGICSVEELNQMLAASAPSGVEEPRDLSPMRGRGLAAPQGFFSPHLNPNRLTQSLPQDGAEQNL